MTIKARCLRLAAASLEAECNALATLLNDGYLRVYSGPQPNNANLPASVANTLLAEFRFAADSSLTVSNGTITFRALTPVEPAVGSGTAVWYRCLASDGVSTIMDGNVAAAGANFNISRISIVAGSDVEIRTFSHVIPKHMQELEVADEGGGGGGGGGGEDEFINWPAPMVSTNEARSLVIATYPSVVVATDESSMNSNVLITDDTPTIYTVTSRSVNGNSVIWSVLPSLDADKTITVAYTGPSGVITTADNEEDEAPAFIGYVASELTEWPTPTVAVNQDGDVVAVSYPGIPIATDASGAATNTTIVGGWDGARTITNRSADALSVKWNIDPPLRYAEPYTITYTGPSGVVYQLYAPSQQAPSFELSGTATEITWTPEQLSQLLDYGTQKDTANILTGAGVSVTTNGQYVETWRGKLGVIEMAAGDVGDPNRPKYYNTGLLFDTDEGESRLPRLITADDAISWPPSLSTPMFLAVSVSIATFPHADGRKFFIGGTLNGTARCSGVMFDHVGVVAELRVNDSSYLWDDDYLHSPTYAGTDLGDFPVSVLVTSPGDSGLSYSRSYDVDGAQVDGVTGGYGIGEIATAFGMFTSNYGGTAYKVHAWMFGSQVPTSDERTMIVAWLRAQSE